MLTLIRFLFLFFFVGMVVRFFVALVGAQLRPAIRQAPQPDRRVAPPRGTPMVRDRVCNTFLPQERALRAVVDGREEYFCSEACRAKALAPGESPKPGR
jgi:YHS domain-containing protein